MSACENDSDFLIGDYTITTTVKLSTCLEENFLPCGQIILPGGFTPGQREVSQWILHRIGITTHGAHQIALDIYDVDDSSQTLALVGDMQDDFIRIESQQDISGDSCHISRLIVLYGLLDGANMFGEIRTILSLPRTASATLQSQPFDRLSCEVYEEVTGRMRDE